MRDEFATGCHPRFVANPETHMVSHPRVGEVIEFWPSSGRWDSRLVYFAESDSGAVKVGLSSKPLRRVGQLTKKYESSFRPPDITGVRLSLCISKCGLSHERFIHYHLETERIVGEWFSGPLTQELLRGLRELAVPYAHVRPDAFSPEETATP